MKIKVRHDGEFVVGGIGQTRDGAPSLLIGERALDGAIFRGAMDIGVGPKLVAAVMERARVRPTSPFENLSSRGVMWVEPIVKVAVSYGRMM